VERDITIAVTVYDRRKYIAHAIQSALAQDPPAKVIVVEDCGPDEKLREDIVTEFGARIIYHRNRKRHGLFDNWNVCLDLCDTPYLCILHDDDFLEPCFTNSMMDLRSRFPARGFYYGGFRIVDQFGTEIAKCSLSASGSGEPDIEALAYTNPVGFPAQLIHVQDAKSVGGFWPKSRFCGDWDMWFKLALQHGAAFTSAIVANARHHETTGRGTMRVDLQGRRFALINVQIKRNLKALREAGGYLVFDRYRALTMAPLPIRYLLYYACYFSNRMLTYHLQLLRYNPPTIQWQIPRFLFRIIGHLGIRFIAKLLRGFSTRETA
jgi:glycosyltransferase involved in cell wall biosynthesis